MRRVWRRTLTAVLATTIACVTPGATASGAGAGTFSILIGNDENEKFVDWNFANSDGWIFGDRVAYRCAYIFLTEGGVNVARVTIERAGDREGEEFEAVILDENGVEQIPQTECGTPDTPLSYGGAPTPISINAFSFMPDGVVSPDVTWATGGCSNGSPYDYLIFEGAPIAKVTVESLGATLSPCLGAPTVDSFAPSSGGFGTPVTVTGSNFTGALGVTFNGVAASFTVDSDSQITATLPVGATSGPIAVTTPAGFIFAAGTFTVTHASEIGYDVTQKHRKVVVKGAVSIPDGTLKCLNRRDVVIQKLRNGNWVDKGTAVTDAAGAFKVKIGHLKGRSRAKVRKRILSSGDVCEAGTS